VGEPVVSSTVFGRTVVFDGLTEGESYLATDGVRIVRFSLEPPVSSEVASRLDALEADVALKADQSTSAAHVGLQTTARGRITANNDTRLSDARTPTGSAGGALAGTFPSPSFAIDMATQAELNAVSANTPTSSEKAALVGARLPHRRGQDGGGQRRRHGHVGPCIRQIPHSHGRYGSFAPAVAPRDANSPDPICAAPA
jgi:hypothetical protein